jgi:ABC-type multidrug transport system permease subunit
MDFSVNAPIIYIIVGAIIALVLAQSIFFLVRALKRAKQLGISNSTLKKTVS